MVESFAPLHRRVKIIAAVNNIITCATIDEIETTFSTEKDIVRIATKKIIAFFRAGDIFNANECRAIT